MESWGGAEGSMWAISSMSRRIAELCPWGGGAARKGRVRVRRPEPRVGWGSTARLGSPGLRGS